MPRPKTKEDLLLAAKKKPDPGARSHASSRSSRWRMINKFMLFIDNKGKTSLAQLELVEIGFQRFIRNI